MPLKMFRCLNPTCCTLKDQGIFHAEYPKCPRCQTDAADPKFGRLIVRLTLVHFDPPTHVPGIGKNYRACDPTVDIQAAQGGNGMPNPFHAGTGTPAAVTCPACKESAEFKAALATEEEDAPQAAKAAMDRLQAISGS